MADPPDSRPPQQSRWLSPLCSALGVWGAGTLAFTLLGEDPSGTLSMLFVLGMVGLGGGLGGVVGKWLAQWRDARR